MPIPWLTVLQTVPWTDVLRNAPKVADGAKKLWSTVSGQAPEAVDPVVPPVPVAPASADAERIAALETRVLTLETAVSDMHGQMLASSELIKALAEQNTQLVANVDADRLRVRRLTWCLAVVAAIAAAALAWAWRLGT
jgi:hypothetical protein